MEINGHVSYIRDIDMNFFEFLGRRQAWQVLAGG